MVKLLLTPLRGNHARTFPYKGHLGLSPVTLAGTVQTEIEEDKTLLQASSVDIRIRCYEAEWSNKCKALNFDKARVIYQVGQRLWSSTGDLATLDEPDLQDHADQQVYKPLGNFKSTWKLSIPVNAIEQGARSTMTFSRWRIWWALEAVIHHKPQRIHGSQVLRHYHLHLMSHAYPAPSRPITWSNHSPSFSATSSPSPPLIEYTAHLDSDTYSPGQRMTLALDLKRTVADSKLSIKKVVVELRRSITMHPDSPHSSPDRDVSLTPPEPSATPTSEVDTEYFNRPISSQRSFGPPLRTPPPPTASTSLSPAHMPNGLGIPSDLSRTETNSVMTLTSTEAHFDSSGVARIVLTGFIPRRKTEHCWSLGETTRTKHLSVRFFLATQIVVKSRLGNAFALPPKHVVLPAVSAEDRSLARQEIQHALQAKDRSQWYSGMRRTSSYQDTAAAASQSARTSSSDEDEELARLRQARRSFASATVDIETSPSTCAAPTSKASSLRKSTASSLSPRFSPPNFLSICGLNKSADQDNTLMYKRSYSDTTDDTAASLDSLSSAKSSTISTTPPSPPMQLYNKLRGRSPVRRIQITLPARCSSSEPSSGTSSPPEDDSATFPESVDHRAKTSGTLKFLKRAARPT